MSLPSTRFGGIHAGADVTVEWRLSKVTETQAACASNRVGHQAHFGIRESGGDFIEIVLSTRILESLMTKMSCLAAAGKPDH